MNRLDEEIIGGQHHEGREGLLVKRRQRRRRDQHRRIHRPVLHHLVADIARPGDRADGLRMGHEHEDAGHDIDDEIAPDRRMPHADKGIDQVKAHNHGHGLNHRHQQPDKGVALTLAQVVHRHMIDQRQRGECCLDHVAVAALRKHR